MTLKNRPEIRNVARARFREKVDPSRVVAIRLVAFLLAGAIPLAVLWQLSDRLGNRVNEISPDSEVKPLSTPIFSLRRTPATLSSEVRISALRKSLRAVVKQLPVNSCLTVDVEGRRVIDLNASIALVPASSLKLLVAASALTVLGEDFKYTTKLLGLVEGARVQGNIYLVGGGDPLLTAGNYLATQAHPTLTPTHIETLIDSLTMAGITSISGSVVGDESRYDTERFSPALGLGVRTTEVGPLGALLVNDGVIMNSPIKPDNPALAAATEFSRLLIERGIAVGEAPTTGVAPSDLAVIGSISSATLSNVVAEMLTNSDNNTAELVVKELGKVSSGEGTRLAGIAAVQATLRQMNLDTAGLVMTDGSGLGRSNRVSCETIAAILVHDGGFGTLTMGLAVAGRSGTLSDLFVDSPVAGIMRAKTGTLTGAKALAGVIEYSDAKAITFSLLLNGPGVSNQGAYRPVWANLTNSLSKFSQHPTAEELSPRGAPEAP